MALRTPISCPLGDGTQDMVTALAGVNAAMLSAAGPRAAGNLAASNAAKTINGYTYLAGHNHVPARNTSLGSARLS